jgi:hypothetical protein
VLKGMQLTVGIHSTVDKFGLTTTNWKGALHRTFFGVVMCLHYFTCSFFTHTLTFCFLILLRQKCVSSLCHTLDRNSFPLKKSWKCTIKVEFIVFIAFALTLLHLILCGKKQNWKRCHTDFPGQCLLSACKVSWCCLLPTYNPLLTVDYGPSRFKLPY